MTKPKILLVSSGDALSGIACKNLIQENHDIVGFLQTYLSPIKKLQILKSAWEKNSLYYSVYIILESAFSKKHLNKSVFGTHTSLSSFLSERGIPTRQISTLAQLPEDFEVIKSANLLLSIRPGLVFKKKFISQSPPILNLHNSRLPAYGGIGGIFRAMANDETEMGTTLHRVDNEKIDSGPIVSQKIVDTDFNKSVFDNTIHLYEQSSQMIAKCLQDANPVSSNPYRDDKTEPAYFSWPEFSVYTQFRRKGGRLLNSFI